jgi:hypothetical protein
MAVVSAVPVLAAAAASALLWPSAARSRLLARFAPDTLVRASLLAGAEWADAEVNRRAGDASLDQDLATNLVLDDMKTGWSLVSSFERRRLALLLPAADHGRRELHTALAARAELSLNTHHTPRPVGKAGSEARVVVGLSAQGESPDDELSLRFARIERVDVNGVPVSFRVPGLETRRGPYEFVTHPYAPDHAIQLPVAGLPLVLLCALPTDLASGPATITITATVGFFSSPMALNGYAPANGRLRETPDTPLSMPWQWEVPAFGDRVSLAIPFQVEPRGPPSPSPAPSVVPP